MAKSGYGKKVSSRPPGLTDPKGLYPPGQSALRKPKLAALRLPKLGAHTTPPGIKPVAMQGGLSPHVGFQAVAKALDKGRK